MRTYNTIADMHEVAKAQWRSYLIDAGYEDAEEFSDEVLWDTAAQIITTADETGIYGTEDKDGKYQCWFTMEMESWARDELDGIEAEIKILEWNSSVSITVPAMVEILQKEFDLTTIATWMMESIPQTLTMMQERVLGEASEDDDYSYSDEQNDAFNKAFWEAIYKANVQ